MSDQNDSQSVKKSSNKLKILYRIYIGLMLILWFFSSFTLFDSYTFSLLYPWFEGGIFDIVELLLYGGLPFGIYKIIQLWKAK